MSENDDNGQKDEIVVIGIACRFPGARDDNEYWENLINGVRSIREIPPERWDISTYYSPDISEPNKSISKWCGLVEDFDRFDSQFFHISPREAASMDPQQRLLLEEAWHCIENSGISPEKLSSRKTGVWVGVMAVDQQQHVADSGKMPDEYSAMGSYSGMLANRVSHIFGFTGPSQSVDAACASSLLAIHEAKRALLTGEAEYALAGGVSLNFHPFKYISFSKARMLSPDGRCKTFDKDADGYVPGDGVGVLLLQRLSDALREGSHIYGIIRGSAVNHVGNALSVTAPKAEAQQEAILAAYQDAGLSPATVTYTEAHGTGTSLGDPIEVEALTQAFQKHTSEREFCTIGSVKTNIGHLEAAAGVAGVIKVLCMMRHRQIPRHLNLNVLNPVINFQDSPFSVATESRDWQSKENGLPLRAGVSSFGMGGVSTHLLLEKFVGSRSSETESKSPPDGFQGTDHLFLLSAKSESSLTKLIRRWQHFVGTREYEEASLRDICATLATGRKALSYRHGSGVTDKVALREAVKTLSDGFSQGERSPANSDQKPVFPRGTPIGLRIGTFSHSGFAEIQGLSERNPLFREQIRQIEETYAKQEIPQRMRTGFFRKPIWSSQTRPLYAFMASHAYVSAILDAGFVPDLIIGEKNGLWPALTASGMAEPEDLIGLFANQGKWEELRFKRPLIPFSDPLTKQTLMPFHFSTAYLREMRENLPISRKMLAHYMDKARLLLENQHTFIRYVEEWDVFLRPSGKTTAQMLDGGNEQEKPVADVLSQEMSVSDLPCPKEAILLSLVIVSSLRRLSRKWSLAEDQLEGDSRFYELADLVTDHVMPKEAVIALFRDEHADVASLAEMLNQRQANMNLKNPYAHIREQALHEIPEPGIWLKKAEATASAVPKGMFSLELGNLSNSAPEEQLIYADPAQGADSTLKQALIQLWMKGADIRWEAFHPEGSFRKVALPVYPFSGERYLNGHRRDNGQPSTDNILDDKEKMQTQQLDQTPALRTQNRAVRTRNPEPSVQNPEPPTLQEKTGTFLKQVLSGILKLPLQRIDPQADLEVYGIDSLIVNRFNAVMEESLGPLPKTLLFENRTLDDLTAYLTEAHAPALADFFSLNKEKPRDESAQNPEARGVFPHPASSTQHPASSIQHPASSIQHPAPSIQHPASSIPHPASDIQHPASLTQHPAPSIQHPASSTPHPTSSTQHPASLTQHPAPSIQHPSPSIRHPASDIQHPASLTQHPAPSIQHPASNSQHRHHRHGWPLSVRGRSGGILGESETGKGLRDGDPSGQMGLA